MKVWELLYDGLNDRAPLVSLEGGENILKIFGSDGKPKQWAARPRVAPFIEKRRKKAKPRADLSYLISGSIILNEKAYQVLKDFLSPFGQLLELDCQGEREYYFNVTNLLECLDLARTGNRDGVISKEVFLPEAIPLTPQIFKDPHTARISIYLNQAGKEKFEKLCADAGLFGARFVEAGQSLI